MPTRVYLSGSIKKGRFDSRTEDSFWTEREEDVIRATLGESVELLNPAKTEISRNDYFVNYGCDLYLVQESDVVLVDLREEKGIGVGAELMFAHFVRRPVVAWLPPNSYYRRELVEDVFGEDLVNWVHPFVYGLCDRVADTLVSACETIQELLADGAIHKELDRSPENAIASFLRKYPEHRFFT